MKKRLSRYSIKVKLIIVIIGVSLALVIIMAITSKYFYENAARKDFLKFSEDASDRLNSQLDLYFEQLKLSTSFLFAGPLPMRSELFYEPEKIGLIQSWLRDETFDYAKIRDIEDMLNNYLALNYNEIRTIYLMSLDGRVISNQNRYIDKIKYKDEVWYKRPLSEQMEVIATHKSEVSGTNVISLLVPFVDLESMQLKGRLVIDLSLNELRKTIIRSSLAEKGSLFIIAEDGTIVYHQEHSYLGLHISETELAPIILDSPSTVQEIENDEILVAFNESQITGWKLVTMVPFSEMSSGVTIARNSIIFAFFIIVFIVLIIGPIIAQKFTKQLRNLKKLMREVENGNLDVQANVVHGNDEVQLLNLSFNRMVIRLRNLIKTVDHLKFKKMSIQLREKEAVIHALQNQINPHVLYNTLEIIRSIAYLEKNERIEIMVRNLGHYYRYTANISRLEVSLQEELDHLDKYLEIVKIRYPKQFQSNYFIHDKYLDTKIVKCSLQPIIENAVKFAIEPQFGKGSIVISAYNEKDVLIIEIADNGPGIPQDKLDELTRKLKDINKYLNKENRGNDSLGITNVHARLVLQYGKKFGVKVASFPNLGTVVSIYIPLKKLINN